MCWQNHKEKNHKKKVKDKSIIDFVIGCEEMVDLINSLIIDEDKEYSLTSYKKTKTGLKVQESDHYTLITNVNATWNKKTSVKRN